MMCSGEFASSIARMLAPTGEELRKMLIDFRQRGGLARSYIAALLGMPKETLRRWEQGVRNPSRAARRLIWLLWCVFFEPNQIKAADQLITWGK